MSTIITNGTHNDNKRIVISLTTLPARLQDNWILPTLQSINNQTRKPDAVYLTLPKIAKRLNQPYPEPSNEIKQLCTVVRINQDYGPVTKVIGGLYREFDPNTLIISLDDDQFYGETFIEEMLEKHFLKPEAAIGSSGVILGKFPGYIAFIRNLERRRYEGWYGKKVPAEGMEVDILCGYSGILYVRNHFPMTKQEIEDDFLSIPLAHPSLFVHDDIYISAYLNSKNIERRLYVVSDVKHLTTLDGSTDEYSPDGLSLDLWGFCSKFMKAVNVTNELGLIKNQVNIAATDTISGRWILYICLILIILIMLIIFVRTQKSKTMKI